jgi:hypothetical protein
MFTTAFMFTGFSAVVFGCRVAGFLAVLKEFFLSVNGNVLPHF